MQQTLQPTWTIKFVKHVSGQDEHDEKHVFQPSQPLQELLKKPEDDLQEYLSTTLQLSDVLEETKVFALDNGLRAEVAWDGSIKISQIEKKSYKLYVQSLQRVVLDNIQASDMSITAPSVSLTGDASIDHLSIELKSDDFDPDQTKVFELATTAHLTTQGLETNGLLLNKGIIDLLGDSSLIETISLVNAGRIKVTKRLNIKTDILIRNSGCIEAGDLLFTTNIFQQVSMANLNPIIKAVNFSCFANEEMRIDAGFFEMDCLELTILGLFENSADIKAKKLCITTQSPSVNKGLIQAESLDIKSYDFFRNQGIIQTEQEMHLYLVNDKLFEQNGMFYVKSLVLDGNQWIFRNTNQLSCDQLHMHKNISLYNHTPLTTEESSGKSEVSIKAIFGQIVLHDYQGNWKNSGFISIGTNDGSLPSLENSGLLVAEALSVTNLQQKGKMRVNKIILSKECQNTGEMLATNLLGSGHFLQSGQLKAENELNVSISSFEQKRISQDPILEAKIATFSCLTLINGKNCQMNIENLKIENVNNPFTNDGDL